MQEYYGEDLTKHLKESLDEDLKQRFLYHDMDDYLFSPNDGKICCLYGLRRTGKTVMMHQAIRSINNNEQCLLVTCEADKDRYKCDTIQALKNAIEEHPKARFIFVDEATKLWNFITASSMLADRYAYEGKKIVVAGTDSLGFWLAKNSELYDRIKMIHTTYIPFREYNYLLGRDIFEYIRYGGTLTNGSMFYNKDELAEYTNTAIADNIFHSLQRWNNGRECGGLEPLMSEDGKDLQSAVNKVIEYHNRQFLAKMINEKFHSHDLGSLADLLEKKGEIDPSTIHTAEMEDRIRILLGIRDGINMDQAQTEILIRYLKDMDVLYEIPQITPGKREYLFTQPGMRHCQSEALAEALISSEAFDVYNSKQKYDILQKMKSDINGGILEDIILYQFLKDYEKEKNISVSKFRNGVGNEIDILISDFERGTSLAIEVKLSDKAEPGSQARHLNNEDFIAEIEAATGTRIINKMIVYTGNNCNIDGILYFKADQLLIESKDIADILLGEHIESIEDMEAELEQKQGLCDD